MKIINTKFVPIIIIILALIVLGGWFYLKANNGKLLVKQTNQLLSSKYGVAETSSKAFGPLSDLTISSQQANIETDSLSSKSGEVVNSKLAQGTEQAQGLDKMMAPGMGSGIGLTMPVGETETYKFKYVGAPLGNLANQQAVYRRDTANFATSLIDRIIRTISLGLVDLSTFKNTTLQNFTIAENIDYGYSVDVNIPSGQVSIFQNWDKWPRPVDGCQDPACFESMRIKKEEIPADEVMIALANNFLDNRKISRDGYLPAQVNNDWQVWYELSEDKTNFYFPEVVDIVFPQVVNNLAVIDEGGSPAGIHVTVDIRSRKVTSVYELKTRQFQKSDYSGETDSDKIIKIAESGGYRNYFYGGINEGKVVNLELGDPTTQLLKMWKDNNGNGEEIYVPALVFPILNPGSFWRKTVVVPLVKEILDNEAKPPIDVMNIEGSPAARGEVKVILPGSSDTVEPF